MDRKNLYLFFISSAVYALASVGLWFALGNITKAIKDNAAAQREVCEACNKRLPAIREDLAQAWQMAKVWEDKGRLDMGEAERFMASKGMLAAWKKYKDF